MGDTTSTTLAHLKTLRRLMKHVRGLNYIEFVQTKPSELVRGIQLFQEMLSVALVLT